MSSTGTAASSSARTTTGSRRDPPGAASEQRRVAGSVAGSARPSEPSTPAARSMVATSTVCNSTMSEPTRDLSSSGVPWAMTRPPSMMTM